MADQVVAGLRWLLERIAETARGALKEYDGVNAENLSARLASIRGRLKTIAESAEEAGAEIPAAENVWPEVIAFVRHVADRDAHHSVEAQRLCRALGIRSDRRRSGEGARPGRGRADG